MKKNINKITILDFQIINGLFRIKNVYNTTENIIKFKNN